ncbi:hypothetical protein ARZXY2_4343 (plasmid) [Arthrobacter sp. ZXY-2]|nr:hypothetical protein ARZXY2_4343 [Arthrobacter sp. ZXY-2]
MASAITSRNTEWYPLIAWSTPNSAAATSRSDVTVKPKASVNAAITTEIGSQWRGSGSMARLVRGSGPGVAGEVMLLIPIVT